MSKIFDWTNEIKKEELQETINVLKNDGIVVFPTETVFGIGCNAKSLKAVKKLYEAKKRPQNKPFSILVSEKNEIEKIAKISNLVEKKIIENFMPGPLTIVLEKNEAIDKLVTANKSTVGVRIPDYKIANTILKEAKLPLATSSANISGENIESDFNKIVKTFGDSVDIFIKGETKKDMQASTIVQAIENKVVILREGKISKESINVFL